MNKEWRVVQLAPVLGLESKSYWVVSKRKLSDEEVASMMAQSFDYDFDDELGICGGCRLIIGVSTRRGATKAQAEAECDRLNGGGKLFDMFRWGEEESNGQ